MNTARTKKPFLREGQYLFDPPDVSRGNASQALIHVTFLEDQSAIDWSVVVQDLVSDDPERQNNAIDYVNPDAPPEVLDALLPLIAKDNADAASKSLSFADDPRVYIALNEAVKRISTENIEAFARALGLIGGSSALPTLRGRLHIESTYTPAGDVQYDRRSSGTVAIAGSVLALDPDASDAAAMLLKMFEHPRMENRHHAIRTAAEVFRHEMRTTAMLNIKRSLENVFRSNDEYAFLTAANVIAHFRPEDVLVRCEKILHEGDIGTRNLAALALTRFPFPRTAQAFATLVRWIPDGDPLDLVIWVVSVILPLIDSTLASELARRGLEAEAPSIRWEALCLAEEFEPGISRPIIENALRDEPDGLLAQAMRRVLGQQI